MKLNKLFDNFMLIWVLAMFYMFPISSINLFGQSNRFVISNFYSIARIVFIVIAFILVLYFGKVRKISAIQLGILILITLIKIVVYNEVDFGIVLIAATLIIYDKTISCKEIYNSTRKPFLICFFVFIIQIVIYSIANLTEGNITRVTSSFLDSNYTAYYGFCLSYYLYATDNKKKAVFLWILMLFTFSRLYIIAVVFFFIFNAIYKRTKQLKFQISTTFYLVIQIVVLVIGMYFIRLYETIQPEYVFLQGFERLGVLLDESNYIRFLANELAVRSMNFASFIIGLKSNTFEGLHIFTNKTIFPHNSMWSIYVQYGMLISIFLISRYIDAFKRYGKKQQAYYMVLIIYHSFLGLSSYYGVDLILQVIIIRSISEFERINYDHKKD